jgi:hypothetical protein
MTSINNRSNQGSSPVGPMTSQAAGEGSDMILWAAAQGQAISKLQVFSTMAKQINEQQ